MKPYKRIWTAFVTAALFAISMPDKFLELYKEFMHSGLTPAFGVALALWVSKEYRNKRLDRRDVRWEKKFNLILDAVGAAEISPVEVPSYKKSSLSLQTEIKQENPRRKKTMKTLLTNPWSKKLSVFLLLVLVNGLNDTLGFGLSHDDVNQITGAGQVYIVSQAAVDMFKPLLVMFIGSFVKKGVVENADTKSTIDLSANK